MSGATVIHTIGEEHQNIIPDVWYQRKVYDAATDSEIDKMSVAKMINKKNH